jgi:general L-amino acid transport system permease protein
MADTHDPKLAPSKPPLWNDPKARALVFQAIALGAVILCFYYIFQNTLGNMERRGITTGFGFLNNEAGFGILMSLIPYDESNSYGRTFFVGLLNTLLVSVIGILLATVLGFVMGVARLSSNWIIARLATIYVETLRNVPLLLQIFFWYVVVLGPLPRPRGGISIGEGAFLSNRGLTLPSPVFEAGSNLILIALIAGLVATYLYRRWAHKRQAATGQQSPVFLVSLGLIIGLPLIAYFAAGMPISWDIPKLAGFNYRGGVTIIPEFIALLWALTTYTAAFIAEIVRAGILAVSHGQTEAAHALGIRNGPTLRLVVIPQALRVIIPPLTSQYLNLTKNSSLATAIGYPDLVGVFMGTTLNQTAQAVEIVAMTMAVYLTISLTISLIMNIYNRRIALTER